MSSEHSELKQKELEHMPKASHGYGGKFGLQQDRMDKARGLALMIHFSVAGEVDHRSLLQ